MSIKKIERKLSLWERSYLPMIAKGLYITAKHFFRNLLIHTFHQIGLGKHWRGAETFQYPEVLYPLDYALFIVSLDEKTTHLVVWPV